MKNESTENLLKTLGGEVRKFARNDRIFDAKTPFACLYYLLDGQIKILSPGKSEIDAMVMWIASPGDWVGVSSFFANKGDYVYTAVAGKSGAATIALDGVAFADLLQLNNDFRREMMLRLSRHADLNEFRVQNSLNTNARGRLAGLLHLLATNERQGNDRSHRPVQLNYSLSDLSELSGISVRQLRRLFRDLEKKEVAQYSKGKLTVFDPDLEVIEGRKPRTNKFGPEPSQPSR